MLQSSNSAFGPGGNAVSFTATINGDVTGDILLDPALIGTIQPAQQPLNTPNSLTTSTTSSTGNIDNTIDLTATTGNATVATNTTAGDATTGTATAVANVINFLNSAVGSGRSFLGVININGNLDGDILLPPNFIDQLLASNVPTVSLAVPDPAGSVTNTTDQSITNAVTASATTGSATVDSNTTAGNGTTGNATTNITTFNLTGSNIIGENALLVFVNVLGTWYGMIFNAPAGATAAELGGGISATLPTPLATTTQNNTSQTINNDINVAATSGNAAVTRNTTAGNATSGDARAAVNVLNIAHSTLSLANWFGVLFINVFGTWNGSFGIDTIAGTIPLKPTPNMPASAPNEHQVDESSSKPQVFRFVATRFASTQTALANSQTEEAPVTEDGKVLAAETVKLAPAASSPHPSDKAHPNYWITAGFVLIGLAMLTGERLYRSHRH
jgi:hypothetical protein